MASKLSQITNNVCNIRYSPRNKWLGQTGFYRGFCTFSDTSYSVRALCVLLANYYRLGIQTCQSIISRYAPKTENDTAKYIKDVCTLASIAPDTIVLEQNEKIKISFVKAIVKIETNTSLSDNDVIEFISELNVL